MTERLASSADLGHVGEFRAESLLPVRSMPPVLDDAHKIQGSIPQPLPTVQASKSDPIHALA
jgi:hypothetical protein